MSNKKYTKPILSILTPIAIATGILTGYNFYSNHNVAYETVEGNKVYKKAEGVLAHTEVTIRKNGSKGVARYGFSGNKFYTDENGDGDVDRIFLPKTVFYPPRGSHDKTFERKEHLEKYPQVFKNADIDFREQIKRFKPFMTKK